MLGLFLAAATAAPGAPVVDPDPKHLAVSPADQAKAKALVEKLASPAYADREQAQADLSGMGRRAVPALTDALARHASPEVRARCQALYPRARAEDLQVRLDTFAADTAGKFEHEVPGWPEFKALASGCGPRAARAVFVEIATAPLGRELVLGDLPPHDLGIRIAARKQELYSRRFLVARRPGDPAPHEPPVGDILALMVAESRIPSRHVPRSSTATVVYTMPTFVSALAAGGERARVYRAVAGKWVATRDEALLMTQAMSVATTLDLPEAAGLGARMMTTPGVNAIAKAQAAMTVAKIGNPKYLPALEAVFKDESLVRPIAVAGAPAPNAVQLRDIGLAAALLLTGQEPREYGFEESGGRRDARYLYTVWRLPPGDRAAALEKWQTWRAANPDFEKDDLGADGRRPLTHDSVARMPSEAAEHRGPVL
ncbi:MAG TPA: hypothetical protein VH092_11905 [Urbifossiella sp.]|nr:hypothetical protein [Urbifossiella sp.]